MSNRFLMIAAVAGVLVAGCAPKREALPPEPIGTPGGGGGSAGPVDTGPEPGSQADFIRSVMADRVYFDTDKFDIDQEDMTTLQSQAAWLRQYPATRVTIEGHCDERGTRDYNLALGERRANGAKNALISLGVAADRISTISYGKERPDALGSDEASWARNRRAVSVTIR